MDYKVEDYNSLAGEFTRLNLQCPNSLAFFPEEIESAATQKDFVFTDSVSDVEKIFRLNNISIERVSDDSNLYRTRKSADWIGPTLFISLSMLTENANMVSIALNVLSNYVTDIFKGSFGAKTAKLDIVVETKKNTEYKKITYSGPSEGLKDLDKIIKSLKK